jgi:signal transduction histidine kinase
MVKLESGPMEMDPRAEPLDAVFAEIEAATAEDWQARDMTVLIELPSPVPAALADARALRSAVTNLVQNAIAFGREGGTVRLSASACGPLVQIKVSDDGEGFEPDQISRLMRPFEQGENALVRRVEGAGLGWPLVTLLCTAMGGDFEVSTAPGEGLEAVITLRRAN